MKKEIKNLLKEKRVLPKKRFGQNFLISKKVLEKILSAADLKKTDIVLEIGPGIGILTKELAKRVRKVIAIEKDQKMVEILEEVLKILKIRNVEIVQGDILKIPISKRRGLAAAEFLAKDYKVVANLPYYITAICIRKFLESPNPPNLMVLMVQKEVGKRICARPPEMSKIAVFSQFRGKPEIVSSVSKKSFWPSPKVDSVILKITPHQYAIFSSTLQKKFTKIVRAGFSQPRKQLINNFSRELNLSRSNIEKWLLENNIKPCQRAESLSLEDWLKLTKTSTQYLKCQGGC